MCTYCVVKRSVIGISDVPQIYGSVLGSTNQIYGQKVELHLNYYITKHTRHPKDAYVREKHIKSRLGKRYLLERLKRFLSLTG